MLTRFRRSLRRPASERGQFLVIFAFAFLVIVMMLGLLFDGARGLVLRREMQNASDAAAMAGANVLQGLPFTGCSAAVGPPPGDPQAAVEAAAKASIAANLPNYNLAEVIVSCPPGWDNVAVQVQLAGQSPTFFGTVFGMGPLDVATSSSAVNGLNSFNRYSVILLDPENPSWPQARRGCPSFLLSGGPTVRFDSSIYINSACTAANGGALSTNGNATTFTLGPNGPSVRIVGEYKPQALTITPAPVEHQRPKTDPLLFLQPQPPPGSPNFASTDSSSLKLQRTTRLIVGQGQSNSTVTLEPGVYKGGIQLRNQSVAYLHPGIYVIQGGGIDLGAQTSLYAVPAGPVSPNIATTWDTTCTSANCGVLIYNTGTSSGPQAMGQVSVAAGATFKVRSYDPTVSVTLRNSGASYTNPDYESLLIWQSRDPLASNTYAQPWLQLNGGGNVVMAGTVYAPQAKVQMGGGSGGGGGSSVVLTLQFIVWDLELSGNSTFWFRYDGGEFSTPPDYGLIE